MAAGTAVSRVLETGAAAERFERMVAALGGPADFVEDFERGLDRIDVSVLSARAFAFSGERAAFDASAAPELRYTRDAGTGLTHVYADVNGDNVADLHVKLAGGMALSGGDFIL